MTMHNNNLKTRFAVQAVAMVAAMLMMTSMATAQTKFGAIYFSQVTGSTGWSYNYNNQYQAEQAALNQCLNNGGTDCVRTTWFRNACGALAVGDGNGWGSHWGNNRNGAEYNALQACNRNATGCRITRWVCTDH